jgi:integrase
MPSAKLTDVTVRNAKPPASGRLELWDSQVPGLGLRITSTGAKSWVAMYRVHGKQRRLTIGPYPAFSLAQAREAGLQAIQTAKRGIDPVEQRAAQIEEERRAKATAPKAVGKVAGDFIEKYAKAKNRSWRETERIFRHDILPAIGTMKLDQVTRRDLLDLLDGVKDRGSPLMANRVLSAVRKFFNWTIERDLLASSPAAGLKSPSSEKSRDRILGEGETKALWKVWTMFGWPFGTALQLMLVTGQRRDEVATMRWRDIDLEKALWTLPREATKSDRLHEVPLSTLAMAILAQVPRRGDLLFSTNGKTPVSGFSKVKERTDILSGVREWRIHDLRRTVASGMARLSIPPHIVEKVLNHSSGSISGVAAVYNRHGYLDEKREALEAWARELKQLCG